MINILIQFQRRRRKGAETLRKRKKYQDEQDGQDKKIRKFFFLSSYLVHPVHPDIFFSSLASLHLCASCVEIELKYLSYVHTTQPCSNMNSFTCARRF